MLRRVDAPRLGARLRFCSAAACDCRVAIARLWVTVVPGGREQNLSRSALGTRSLPSIGRDAEILLGGEVVACSWGPFGGRWCGVLVGKISVTVPWGCDRRPRLDARLRFCSGSMLGSLWSTLGRCVIHASPNELKDFYGQRQAPSRDSSKRRRAKEALDCRTARCPSGRPKVRWTPTHGRAPTAVGFCWLQALGR